MMEVTASGLVTQPFLRGMPARHLDALAEAASEVIFPAGHRIFADGDYADKFWLIQSGYVALDVLVPGEGLAVVGRVGIGGLVGWSWLLPPYQWAFGAVCVPRSGRSSSTRRPSGTAARPILPSATSSPGGCSRWSRDACRTPGPG